MGRVFLARQLSMASRLVVLKLGHYLSGECQKLAKLQHRNIVPVHSFHQHNRLQAVCMPYRGPVTLGHLVSRLQSENLPTLSGHALTTAILDCRRSRELSISSPNLPTGPAPEVDHQPKTARLIARLNGLNFVDAVLTLARQLADGLRFAHAEGIVHSDLKPANVLLAEDGCPQLIDFGISYDQSNPDAKELVIGGTRPYSSPEQLNSLLHTAIEHDARTDIYSLGVILYELLTGRLPFTPNYDTSDEAIEQDRANRFTPPPSPRAVNARVPVAVAAIVAKCLAPEAAERYQSAAELIEDLDRQLARRPLRYAPNPSRRELVLKWATRNRLPLATGLMLSLVGGSAAIAFGYADRSARQAERVERMEALAAAEPFAADLREAEFLFGMTSSDPSYRDRAWDTARRALDRLDGYDDERWFDHPRFAGLTPDRQAEYRRDAAALMLLMANARAEHAVRTPDPAARRELLGQAQDWNRRAAVTHPTADECRSLLAQRGYLAQLAGDSGGAAQFTSRADALPHTPSDGVMVGRQLLSAGRVQAALNAFTDAANADPKNFWATFNAARSLQLLKRDQEAVALYDVCAPLSPGFFGTVFNRGLSRLRLGKAADAEADFDRAIAACPEWAEAYYQRAFAREALGRYRAAIEDLDRALKLGFTPTSVYLVRSRVYGRLDDKPAAERDFAEGIKVVPADERGWLARAQARLYRDPAGALADYEKALELNPRLVYALQGKAHLLSRAGKTDDAAKALTLLIEINPESPDAWSGRGVLHARRKDREAALADARQALKLTQQPATRYQVAGIYATTSRTHPDDRREALSLLDGALRAGFGFEHLDKDPELDPIRKDPEFAKTVTAAKVFWESVKKTD